MFSIGDKVWWKDKACYRTNECVENGTIEYINDDIMFIRMNGCDNKVSISAKKISGTWFAYRSYEGYLEEISKDIDIKISY